MVSRPKIIIQIAMKTSLSKKWDWSTKSAFDKNLNANASSKNPRTTFTEFNQPPDCGSEFNQPGKAAKNAKGSAIAKENPSIPRIGPIYDPPEAASTKRVPTIGPVQENETKHNVSDIKKVEIKPLYKFDFESTVLDQELGRVISKSPNKESAKATNIAKKIKFSTGLVDIWFKISGLIFSRK